MPIKFRCTHCRQFLGISRSKAGEVVDCPTCGRAVRVPQLDGRVDPLPQPELDMGDARLTDALDQLAMIGQLPAEEFEIEFDELDGDDPVVTTPAPLPEPVPVEPPLPPEPVNVPSRVKDPPARSAPTEAPSNSATAEHSNNSPNTTAAMQELAALASAANEQQTPLATTSLAGQRFASHRVSLPIVAGFFLAATVAFGLGFLLGSRNGSPTIPPAETNETVHGNETDSGTKNGGESISPALKGRITYQTESGDNKPDRGARVIVFPENRDGEARLSVAGFRPSDSETDFQIALAALGVLGGNVTIVGDDGTYKLPLKNAGTYHVLVLSHYQPRDESDLIPQALTGLLAEYFEQPQKLLGKVSFDFSQIRYRGNGTEIRDHSFDHIP